PDDVVLRNDRAPDHLVAIRAAAVSAPHDVVFVGCGAPDDVVAVEHGTPDDVVTRGRGPPDDVVALSRGSPDDVLSIRGRAPHDVVAFAGAHGAPDDVVAGRRLRLRRTPRDANSPGAAVRVDHPAGQHVIAPEEALA